MKIKFALSISPFYMETDTTAEFSVLWAFAKFTNAEISFWSVGSLIDKSTITKNFF